MRIVADLRTAALYISSGRIHQIHKQRLPTRAGLTFMEMVAELRARARKGAGQSSNYRGVSLLRATGRWHAQINAGGKQVPRACMQAGIARMHASRCRGHACEHAALLCSQIPERGGVL